MSKDAISPDLLQVAGDIGFVQLPFEKFIETDLEPGHLVDDIQKLSDFSVAEAAICRTVIAAALGDDEQGPDPIVTKTPMGDLLRPKGFNGRLLEGHVALLPFSPERVKELDKRHAPHLENYLTGESRFGWRVFFCGLLRKTNAGTAPFMREALYFQKARAAHGSAISRVVGPTAPLIWTPIPRKRLLDQDTNTATPGSGRPWLRTKHSSTRHFV